MGAIVFATDVRMASKEQVESLGGKFLTVEGSENLETEGGYAKEASDDFKKKQEELLAETLKKIDIVVCTALIPGKKAPVIIKENMISNMQTGSVIYDLAAVQGGNTAFTEVDKVVNKNGIKSHIFILPYEYQTRDCKKELLLPQRKIIALSKDISNNFYDLTTNFCNYEKPKKLFLKYDPMHLSKEGHNLVFNLTKKIIDKNE